MAGRSKFFDAAGICFPPENGNEGERLIDETDYQIIEKYKWSTEGETKLFVDIVFVPKTV